ncbi:hypothetical protein GOB14_32245 [Sinorhizobium meliloti]|nr:hypothetical protein [Sinorhizobium meliloti]RVP15454.1 hypothetical protein CN080_33040 [Sinorhizobium meliloti]
MQPSEADLRQPALRPFLDRYIRGKAINVVENPGCFGLPGTLSGTDRRARTSTSAGTGVMLCVTAPTSISHSIKPRRGANARHDPLRRGASD